MMVAQHYECIKFHRIIYFKVVKIVDFCVNHIQSKTHTKATTKGCELQEVGIMGYISELVLIVVSNALTLPVTLKSTGLIFIFYLDQLSHLFIINIVNIWFC